MEKTPVTKDGVDKSGQGKPLRGEQASKARRRITVVNYMTQDRPDIDVVAGVLSQRMASPTEGTKCCLKRVIRHLVSHPHGVSTCPQGSTDGHLRIWIGSDWVVDVASGESCSGGRIQRNGGTICHRSQMQASVAYPQGKLSRTAQ